MAERFKKLRQTGELGGYVADFLTVLTANWQLVVSALIGLVTGSWAWLRGIALDPRVYIGVAAFLAALWTLVGIYALVDRRKPRQVQSHSDYRYGLTFEGFVPNFSPEDATVGPQGTLQFLILLRNFSPGPIKYVLEDCDIRIGTRTIPKYKQNSVTGYMARGSGRTSHPEGFGAGSLKEFYGKGETKGTADFAITYGPPDGEPLRRLKLSIEMTMVFPPDGKAPFGYGDNIISEQDEPFRNRD